MQHHDIRKSMEEEEDKCGCECEHISCNNEKVRVIICIENLELELCNIVLIRDTIIEAKIWKPMYATYAEISISNAQHVCDHAIIHHEQ